MSPSAASSVSTAPPSGSRLRPWRAPPRPCSGGGRRGSGSTIPVSVVAIAPQSPPCAIPLVAELGHQRRSPRRRAGCPNPVGAWARTTRIRASRAHDGERAGRAATVRRRVGERPEDVEELDDRPGHPCVTTNGSAPMRRSSVDEVQVLTVDLGLELRPLVETRFGCAPVELVLPVRAELLEIGELGAVVPSASSSCAAIACAPAAHGGRRGRHQARRCGRAKPWVDRCTRQ